MSTEQLRWRQNWRNLPNWFLHTLWKEIKSPHPPPPPPPQKYRWWTNENFDVILVGGASCRHCSLGYIQPDSTTVLKTSYLRTQTGAKGGRGWEGRGGVGWVWVGGVWDVRAKHALHWSCWPVLQPFGCISIRVHETTKLQWMHKSGGSPPDISLCFPAVVQKHLITCRSTRDCFNSPSWRIFFKSPLSCQQPPPPHTHTHTHTRARAHF